LAAITTVPTYTLKANPTGSQTAAAAGLNADHSASALDFSGLCSVTAAAGTVTDLGGAQLTSVGDGTIAEFETLLFNLANSYFLTPTDAYMNAAIFSQVCSAIITTGNSSTNVSRINIEANSLGQITGGTFPVAYRSKFAGAAMGESTPGVINLRYHPLMADGCILFDMADNPYPDAEIPAVRRIMTMREYYSIPWPLRTRKYEEGVYVNETLQHYIPFSTVMLTGIGHA
jgi:hypothetical protein